MIKELTTKKIDSTDSWDEMKMVDACKILTCGVASTPKYVDEEIGIPFLSAQNVRDGEVVLNKYKYISKEFHEKLTSKNKPTKGDLLYSRVGAKYGEAGVVEHNFEFSVYVSVTLIRAKKEILNNYFLKHYLNSPRIKELAKQSITSSGVPNLNVKSVREFPVPLPPLTQQKQIVAILDKAFASIDAAKANAEQNLQNTKELFESYLQNIFENKGDDWEMKALGEICEMIKRGSQPKYTESADGEIVLNQKCIRDHKINLSVARKHDTSKKTINKERYIQLGDGLINSTGTGTLGRVAQVRELDFSAFVDTHITIVRPKKEVFYLDFFGWALIYIEKIIQKSGEGASGQTELSRKVVEKLIISYPNEMKQQKKIVQKLDSLSVECKKIEAIYTKKIADLDEMKKSVLQKAFSGQLNTIN
tara:strand:+ start:110 stop:1366 length:1257 start_codon:yes stop_codon:yes gene_type:complete